MKTKTTVGGFLLIRLLLITWQVLLLVRAEFIIP